MGSTAGPASRICQIDASRNQGNAANGANTPRSSNSSQKPSLDTFVTSAFEVRPLRCAGVAQPLAPELTSVGDARSDSRRLKPAGSIRRTVNSSERRCRRPPTPPPGQARPSPRLMRVERERGAASPPARRSRNGSRTHGERWDSWERKRSRSRRQSERRSWPPEPGYAYTDGVEFRLQRTVRSMSAEQHASGAAARDYWRNRPPRERLAAVEFLRRQHGGTGAGLRRVLRVVDRAPR